ncbi:restriction endonuclease subunit S [Lactobacillus delbrueckii]|uniref:restriction endonuclease subunit S n=2 Tax=Lactobacillus delbrueckii TaxID=1584 RepID=UPI0037CC873A
MKDEKKAPKLRFKGFTDDWEQCKLGDVCEEVSGNNGNVKGLPILTISAANGWMNQKDRFSQVIAGNELKKYTLLKKGHLAYNHGNSKQAKYGTVFVQNLYDQALVPRVYHSFKMKTENNPYYVEYYFATKKLDRELARLVTSGARMDGLLNINKKDFFKIKFEVPTPVEQSLIGTILQKLDQIITLHEEKKCLLERLKSALLQKMFADKSGYPDIRFEGFSDEWEQCKLGDVTSSYSGGTPTAGTSNYYGGAIPFIRSGEISKDSTELTITEEGLNNSAAKLVKRGDILYALYGATSGEVSISRLDGAINQAILAIKPCIGYDSYLLMSLLKNEKKKIREKFLQGGQGNLSARIVKNIKLDIPSINEQTKIGCLLLQLDRTITLHEEKKRQLERLKSALMQKMFADKSGYPAVRFNGFCDEWKKQKLGDIVETITDYVAAGSFASLRENVIYRSEPCYAQLIRTADLKSNFSKIAPVYVDKQAFDFLYRVSLDKESVILPNIGNCGEVYYVDPHELPYMRNVLGPNAILIRSSSLNNHFLSILFQSHNFQKSLKLIISPNGQTKFNKTELKRIKMVLPMDVNEQNSLSAFFKMINTAISLQEHKSNILKELKSSLLQNMFI